VLTNGVTNIVVNLLTFHLVSKIIIGPLLSKCVKHYCTESIFHRQLLIDQKMILFSIN